MVDPLILAFVPLASAVLGSLLTIVFLPKLQHNFWKRQRRAELRLTTIKELNEFTSNIIVSYMKDMKFSATLEHTKIFYTIEPNVKALFSSKAYEIFFEKMSKIIVVEREKPLFDIISTITASRDKAMQELYKEAGIL